MTSRSKLDARHRVRLRIPWVFELEAEGVVAVVGSLLLAAVLVGLAVYRAPSVIPIYGHDGQYQGN